MYRHPKGDVNNFITSFNEKLQQLKRGNTSKYYIAGDFDTNVNPTTANESSSSYLNVLASTGANLFIDKPTRVFGETRTLINYIITNDTSNIIYPSVFLSDISDHFAVACLVANNSNSKNNRSHINKVSYSYRDMSRFDIEQCRLELINSLDAFSTTLSLETSTDKNFGFTKFINVLSDSIDKHAPFKEASRKKLKLISKPWITKKILVSIKKKQKLHAKFYKTGTEAQKLFYKIYANKLTKIKRLSKKLYLQQEIIKSRHDMRKFWGIMKTLLPNNHNSSQPVSLSFDGNKLTNPKDIANCFNTHFCSIGKSLADKIDSSCPLSYCKYLQNRTKASMYFRPAIAAEIFNVIFQLNSNKSCSCDGIIAPFVEIAAKVISPILAVLMNACFDIEIFPSCLKIA